MSEASEPEAPGEVAKDVAKGPAPKASKKGSNARVALVVALVLLTVVLPVGVALAVRSAAFETFRVPQSSMYPTIAPGEVIGVDKWVYGPRLFGMRNRLWQGRAPQVGEVVVFAFPRDPTKDFVGRVIGVAGDRVRVFPDGRVERNGDPVRKCPVGVWPLDPQAGIAAPHEVAIERTERNAHLVMHRALRDTGGPEEATEEFCARDTCTVPAGHVFTLGDNRDNSFDGRHWGFVPVSALRGRAVGVMQSAEPTRVGSRFDGELSSLWVPAQLRDQLGMCRL